MNEYNLLAILVAFINLIKWDLGRYALGMFNLVSVIKDIILSETF